MTDRIIRTLDDVDTLAAFLRGKKLPVTVSIRSGKVRSTDQNRLQRLWLKEIAEQADDGQSTEEWRGYCKLRFGVPIRRRDDNAFRERYDAMVKPLPYAHKLAMMQEPFDFAVTRGMKVDQKREYLDTMFRHFTEAGFVLTVPQEVSA